MIFKYYSFIVLIFKTFVYHKYFTFIFINSNFTHKIK